MRWILLLISLSWPLTATADNAPNAASNALAVAPPDLSAYWQAVRAHENGELDLAAKLLSEHLEQEPRDVAAWYLAARVSWARADLPASFRASEQALRHSRRKHLPAMFLRAQIFRLEGNLSSARQALEEAARMPGATGATWYHLAQLYRAEGRPDTAIWALNKALELAPEMASSYNLRGAIRHDRRQYDRARADFQAALERSPDYHQALANLAQSHLAMNQLAAALEAARAARRKADKSHYRALEQLIQARIWFATQPDILDTPIESELGIVMDAGQPDGARMLPVDGETIEQAKLFSAPQPDHGHLRIISPKRWLQVVSGERRWSMRPGEATLLLENLPAGEFKLSLWSATGQSIGREQRIDIPAGMLVHASLQRNRLEVLHADQDARLPPGSLELLSDHGWCNIILNELPQGNIPPGGGRLLLESLTSGTHRLEVRDPAGKLWYEGPVSVASGVLRQVQLEPDGMRVLE